MSLRAIVLARLASYSQHSSDTTCHIPVLRNRTEASIRVPRMFKSHACQQYDKQMKCYKQTSIISYIMTQGSEKDYISASSRIKLSVAQLPQA
jgi:hypothetical protein